MESHLIYMRPSIQRRSSASGPRICSLVFEFTETDTPIHTRFTDRELALLWNSLGIINNVDIVLIYIYTGFRPSELLEIQPQNVHLDERYIIGGMKTETCRKLIMGHSQANQRGTAFKQWY